MNRIVTEEATRVSTRPTPIDPADVSLGEVFPIEPTPDVVVAAERESEAFIEAQRWRWLESTRQLQTEHFGVTYPLVGEALADYVTVNHSALVLEASELLSEFGWKPWAQQRGWVNRANALKEAVDVAHFLANILCAIGVTDKEWVAAYQAKQEVNRRRQRDGYDGVAGKCPKCRRSYDDDIDCTPGGEPQTVINASGDVAITYYSDPHCTYV